MAEPGLLADIYSLVNKRFRTRDVGKGLDQTIGQTVEALVDLIDGRFLSRLLSKDRADEYVRPNEAKEHILSVLNAIISGKGRFGRCHRTDRDGSILRRVLLELNESIQYDEYSYNVFLSLVVITICVANNTFFTKTVRNKVQKELQTITSFYEKAIKNLENVLKGKSIERLIDFQTTLAFNDYENQEFGEEYEENSVESIDSGLDSNSIESTDKSSEENELSVDRKQPKACDLESNSSELIESNSTQFSTQLLFDSQTFNDINTPQTKEIGILAMNASPLDSEWTLNLPQNNIQTIYRPIESEDRNQMDHICSQSSCITLTPPPTPQTVTNLQIQPIIRTSSDRQSSDNKTLEEEELRNNKHLSTYSTPKSTKRIKYSEDCSESKTEYIENQKKIIENQQKSIEFQQQFTQNVMSDNERLRHAVKECEHKIAELTKENADLSQRLLFNDLMIDNNDLPNIPALQ